MATQRVEGNHSKLKTDLGTIGSLLDLFKAVDRLCAKEAHTEEELNKKGHTLLTTLQKLPLTDNRRRTYEVSGVYIYFCTSSV
jgi:hypothetical protein